jgi:hypothetical protein
MRLRRAGALGLAIALVGRPAAEPAPPHGGPVVRVRAGAAFVDCATAAVDAFTRTHGVVGRVEAGDPSSVDGVDVVVGDDSELTRTLEGGLADVPTAVDLGYVPWVLVTPADDPSAPRSLAELDTTLTGPLHVFAGPAGREARAAIRLAPERMVLSADAGTLRSARSAVVPVTLAGRGRHRPLGLRPLLAVAAARREALERRETQLLLGFLRSAPGQSAFERCVAAPGPSRPAARPEAPARGFARGVEDWWLPACSLRKNGYSEPAEVLGPPDAANTGGPDRYRGLMSLGQGGYVVVDMGQNVFDQSGDDIRVYQTTSSEPVTVYVSDTPTGPFTLLAFQRFCGNRTGGGVFSNHCSFDLGEGQVSRARYVKVEDGELYPCLAGNTITEGADIDAVESLNR